MVYDDRNYQEFGITTWWKDIIHDDYNCKEFGIKSNDQHLIGSFRIHPRPVRWQFTSQGEKRRHKRMLELDEIKQGSSAKRVGNFG